MCIFLTAQLEIVLIFKNKVNPVAKGESFYFASALCVTFP